MMSPERKHTPFLDNALDSFSHACWFSTLDLQSSQWQVKVDCHKTSFITHQGLFEFKDIIFQIFI